jgi:hypothetical protein
MRRLHGRKTEKSQESPKVEKENPNRNARKFEKESEESPKRTKHFKASSHSP